jgi:alpha-tubulin suppressor-like RCC1 family protein
MKILKMSLIYNYFTLFLILLLTGSSLFAQNLQISGGNNFSASLCSDGKVYAWGKNDAGQLGRDATNTKYAAAFSATPQLVYLPVGNTLTIKQVDAGSGNTGIALACNGSVWEWGGECGNGNIGNGTVGGSCTAGGTDGNSYYSAMQQVMGGAQGGAFLTNISYINESTVSSYVVESGTGKVLAWGDNARGELGNGTAVNTGNTYTPSYVLTAAGTPLTGISMVEGTDYSGYALGTNGLVYSWGYNSNMDLGRTVTAANQYYATPVQAWDYTKNDGSLVNLSNIVTMTGGDTHGLAVDANGDLWSWGGDWGPGQRGGGSCGCNNVPYATKVIAPAATCGGKDSWKIGPWLTGVKSVSAGQQHSIVLMNDGTVITFGNNTNGQLGNGTTTSSGCPVTVLTAANTPLQNIVAISDGDLWSFALTSSGQVYVWGENVDGELGIPGNTTDQLYAYLNPAIPTACTGSLLGCPVADLGADILKCPNASVTLLAGDNGDTYTYSWYYGPSSTGPWTLVSGTTLNQAYNAGAGAKITVTTPQFYKVVISDTRAYVANQCGPCPASSDVVQVTDRTPPVGTSAAGTCGTTVCFNISSTGAIDNNAFDWYAAQTGGSKLNTSGTTNPFCAAKTSLVLNGSNYEIWVDDKRTFQSTVGPTTAPCAAPTVSSSNKFEQEFVLYDTAIFTSVNVYYKTYTLSASNENVTINVYSNDPNKNSTSTDGVNTLLPIASGTVTLPRTSTTLTPFTLSGFNLTLPGTSTGTKYWLQITGLANGEFGEFTCAASYPYSDAIVGRDVVVMKGSTASLQAIQQASYDGYGYNWTFKYTDGYPCGRFKLTAPSGTTACLLPVEFLYLHGENKGNTNVLSWATSVEKNSRYFEVMRSYDGAHWTVEGKVDAAGNSSVLLKYSFNDIVSQSGVVYYQIIETDIDGTTTRSQTITLTSDILKQISIIPNPNNGQFIIETHGLTGMNTLINLYDALGRQVYQASENFSNGITAKNIAVNNLPAGIYFITISDLNYTNRQKLIIE